MGNHNRRPVYMADIGRLAHRISRQIEALADRAPPEHRAGIVSCVLMCVGKRYAEEPEARSALLMAVVNANKQAAAGRA